MYDTLIIGAGLSGLSAGIRLAYYNQRVCIVEQHTTIGGLNSFYRLRGRNYDVGLHAMTNYVPKGTRHGPLARLLRQLRFRWDDFALVPQIMSSIDFPGVQLRFTNDIELLQSEIADKFPDQIDNFRKLLDSLIDYDDLESETYYQSTRKRLAEIITDPLLREMLLCPLMWYGNAREQDMDFGAFSIMFRSIYLEGFARPAAGVRVILKNLVRRYRSLGGELRLRAAVRRILTEDGRAVGVELEDGQQLTARNICSSAGFYETMRLLKPDQPPATERAGQMSFIEAISVLDRKPQQLGHDRTIIFFNDSEQFQWQRPEEGLCDDRTGVICCPDNFMYSQAPAGEGTIRVTLIADHHRWNQLQSDAYQLAKLTWYDRAMETAARYVPEFRHHVVDTDLFTPLTIRRFTGHFNGAVYGSPEKHLNGRTSVANLYVCGTDQGYVGIVGTIISGVLIANRYLLQDSA